MRYAWIRDQPGYLIRRLCRALNVSVSGHCAWRDRRPGPRAEANARLLERIHALHAQSRHAYGALRLWQALRREGESCGRHRVRRLRRAHGIETKRRQRYVRTRGTYQVRRLGWLHQPSALRSVSVAMLGWQKTEKGTEGVKAT